LDLSIGGKDAGMTSKPKSRLGRGLSSLISVSSGEDQATAVAPVPPTAPAARTPVMREIPPVPSAPANDARALAKNAVLEIPLSAIVPNPHQPRRQMDEASIRELAQSLKSSGLIQPIVVRKNGEQYELIAGERRWRAAKLAGLASVPAIVRDADSFEQAQLALIENVQRENLNAIDRALAYRSLMNQLGLTQAELASRMGEDRSSIANFLRLLDLPALVQTMIADGRLSLGHAKILAGVDDPADQERLANLVVTQSLSVRNLERQLQEGADVETKAAAAPSAHVAELEKDIARQLGLRVQVRAGGKKGRGKLILHYASLDQFDELMGRLGVKVESI
jgi:ParB family transcriptional regulator, chromosome partitioning protein